MLGVLFISMSAYFLAQTVYLQAGLGWSVLKAGLVGVPFAFTTAAFAGFGVTVLAPQDRSSSSSSPSSPPPPSCTCAPVVEHPVCRAAGAGSRAARQPRGQGPALRGSRGAARAARHDPMAEAVERHAQATDPHEAAQAELRAAGPGQPRRGGPARPGRRRRIPPQLRAPPSTADQDVFETRDGKTIDTTTDDRTISVDDRSCRRETTAAAGLRERPARGLRGRHARRRRRARRLLRRAGAPRPPRGSSALLSCPAAGALTCGASSNACAICSIAAIALIGVGDLRGEHQLVGAGALDEVEQPGVDGLRRRRRSRARSRRRRPRARRAPRRGSERLGLLDARDRRRAALAQAQHRDAAGQRAAQRRPRRRRRRRSRRRRSCAARRAARTAGSSSR